MIRSFSDVVRLRTEVQVWMIVSKCAQLDNKWLWTCTVMWLADDYGNWCMHDGAMQTSILELTPLENPLTSGNNFLKNIEYRLFAACLQFKYISRYFIINKILKNTFLQACLLKINLVLYLLLPLTLWINCALNKLLVTHHSHCFFCNQFKDINDRNIAQTFSNGQCRSAILLEKQNLSLNKYIL